MFEFLDENAEDKLVAGKNSYGYMKANFTRMGIPDPATDLRVPKDEFDEALTAAEDPNHTAADIREKNRTQKLVIKAFRKYANENLVHNPRLTSVDILELQLHERKPASPIHPPDYPPIIIVDTSKSRQATLKYYVLPGEHQRMGKPKNVKACIVRWVKGRTKPTHISEFVNEAVGTDGPIVIHFDEDERGDTIWFIAVWQIEREHLESPASDPAMFIVS